MEKETITISHQNGVWMVTYSDPVVIAAFNGCATIPTPYTTQIDAITISEIVQKANPDYSVLVDFIL